MPGVSAQVGSAPAQGLSRPQTGPSRFVTTTPTASPPPLLCIDPARRSVLLAGRRITLGGRAFDLERREARQRAAQQRPRRALMGAGVQQDLLRRDAFAVARRIELLCALDAGAAPARHPKSDMAFLLLTLGQRNGDPAHVRAVELACLASQEVLHPDTTTLMHREATEYLAQARRWLAEHSRPVRRVV